MSDQPVTVITGAGSGVGQALACLLAEAGHRLVLVGRTRAKLEQTVGLIEADLPHPPQCQIIPADLTQPPQAQDVVDETIAEFKRLDNLANVAGVAPWLPLKDVTPEVWRQCIDTNMSAVVGLTVAAWPIFESQKSGLIVNVSSMAAYDPFPNFAVYASSKAALNMFTHCVAAEGKKLGIRAVGVAPGAIETAMLRANFSEKLIPKDKTLDPVEVASVLSDCITGERAFDSGQTIQLPSP